MSSPSCKWTSVNDAAYWETACGRAFSFENDYGPVGNGMKFCAYCGGVLVEHTPTIEKDTDE